MVALNQDSEAICKMENFETRCRRHIPSEDKVRLVLEFLSSKSPVSTLCKKYETSASNYYRWRKTFVIAGMEALRRQPQGRSHGPSRICKRHRTAASVEAVKEDLRQAIEALRPSGAERKPKLPDTARSALLQLIEAASIQKASAIAIAGIPRSTYYRWRKTAILNISTQGQAQKHVRVTDQKSVKEAVFKALHSPPSDHGFNRTTWKVVDLQHALKEAGLPLGKHAIRTIIKDAGYRWRKAKKVL